MTQHVCFKKSLVLITPRKKIISTELNSCVSRLALDVYIAFQKAGCDAGYLARDQSKILWRQPSVSQSELY